MYLAKFPFEAKQALTFVPCACPTTTAVATLQLCQLAREPRALQDAFADELAMWHAGGFVEIDANDFTCCRNRASVHPAFDGYLDRITNVDACRLAAINPCPVIVAFADSVIACAVVGALRRANFDFASNSSPVGLAKASASDTHAVSSTVEWTHAGLTTGSNETLFAFASVVNAVTIAGAAELAHKQGASLPGVSGLANACASLDVAFAMTAALIWACPVVAKLACSTEESRLAFTSCILAYPSFIAEHRAAFDRASLARVSC